MPKNFRDHFFMLYEKLKKKENFAFLRFSDGELRIMQNQTLILADNHFQIGKEISSGQYKAEDHKEFLPERDGEFRERLMASYQVLDPQYFVGLSCSCCVGEVDFKLMKSWYPGDPESDQLTWSNLWVNGNYPLFISYVLPLFKDREIVYVVNENAELKGLPFKVKKDFRVGKNCIVNDIGLVETMKNWVSENQIKNHVFLFSASSLSNVLQHELFKLEPENTYIDIGTTLNPYMKMEGRRGYLVGGPSINKVCIW